MQTFPLFGVPLLMASGFMARVKDMVFYLIGYSYLSFFRFSFQAGIYIEFDNARVDKFQTLCKIRPIGCFEDSCAITSPNNAVCNPFSIYDFYEDSYWWNILFLLLLAVVFRVISSIIFCLFVADKPIPYDEIPPSDSFKNPNNYGKQPENINEVNIYGGNKRSSPPQRLRLSAIPRNQISPFPKKVT